MQKKVGILTWHCYCNFGSALQAYALQETIKDLGYKPQIINYRNQQVNCMALAKDTLKYILTKFNRIFPMSQMSHRYMYPFVEFQKEKFIQSKCFSNIDSFDCSKYYNTVVCGSDQIWAPNVFNPVYMLDFVPDNVRKVSYAASIGLNSIPKEYVQQYKEYLSCFNNISVRESKGQQLLKDCCDIEATVVADPTLLVHKNKWKTLQKPCDYIKKDYIMCYFLNTNHKYKDKVLQFAKLHGLDIIGISTNPSDASWMYFLKCVGPQEFLWLIDNSSYIFTDSYHGAIFSLLFEKRFVVFERFNSTDKNCQNSRLDQLKKWFGIDDQVFSINNYKADVMIKTNYEIVNEKLSNTRELSLQFLQDALK